MADACKGKAALIRSVERKEKTEKPPTLYDLTTLQRDANRQLGYTAQQTLDYLQALYEKKLCTYPRTDSRFLTADMERTVPVTAVTIKEGKTTAPKLCATEGFSVITNRLIKVHSFQTRKSSLLSQTAFRSIYYSVQNSLGE